VSCHYMKEEFAFPLIHPPFKERSCTTCHHPHSSNYYGILQDNQKNVCFSCHVTIAQLIKKPYQHNPFFKANCTICHKPHSGIVDSLLLEQMPPLCYNCHDSIRLEFLKLSHHPVRVSWTCLKCHGPHAESYPKLVVAKDNELCFSCHEVITKYSNRTYYEASGHGKSADRVGRGLCLNCHTPHGSEYVPLEVIPEIDLCYLCHEKNVFGREYTVKTHPVDDPYVDERRNKKLLCTYTCHDPHGTQYWAMKIWDKDALCLICHQYFELP
ncbi:MAG: cytochrome c3 family protein, partial [Actinomycetia bacterium]|nr:cytochrome c3 family protein [Actinomycetes bacterium]